MSFTQELVLLASFAVSGAAAQSHEWVSIGTTDVSEVFVDTANVVREGTTVTYWMKTRYSSPQPGSKGRYDETVTQWRDDCSARTTVIVATQLSLEGKPLGARVTLTADEQKQQTGSIAPRSVAEAVHDTLCR